VRLACAVLGFVGDLTDDRAPTVSYGHSVTATGPGSREPRGDDDRSARAPDADTDADLFDRVAHAVADFVDDDEHVDDAAPEKGEP
jgi:hypothetical protein